MSSQHDAAVCRCHAHAKIRHTVLANLVRRQQDRLRTMDGLVAAVKAQHAQHGQLREERRQLEAAVAAKNHAVQRLHQRLGTSGSRDKGLRKPSRYSSAYLRPVSSESDKRSPIRSRRTSKNLVAPQRLSGQSVSDSRRSSAAPFRTSSEILRDAQRRSSDERRNSSPRFSTGDRGLTVSSGSIFTTRRASSTQTDDLSEGPLGSVDAQHSILYGGAAPDGKKASTGRNWRRASTWRDWREASTGPDWRKGSTERASQVNPDEPRVWTRSHWHRNKDTRRWLWGALGTVLVGCGVVGALWWGGWLERWWGRWYGMRVDKCSYCWLFRDGR